MSKTILNTSNPNTEINSGIEAAKSGNLSELETWLKNNNPNHYDSAGWTPLLWAAVRGQAQAVKLLLENNFSPADINMAHRDSQSLAIHLAGHNGSVDTVDVILNHCPEHLNAVLDVNGHTVLLQAVFYGHLDLAKFVLEKGARTDITTARGLGAMEFATQFQNYKMMELVKPYNSTAELKSKYYREYLAKIAPIVPDEEKGSQELSNKLVNIIENGIKNSFTSDVTDSVLNDVRELVQEPLINVNRLGEALQQPPLIVCVTGNNGFPENKNVAKLRYELAKILLDKGADPSLHEKHPMGAQTIIRACVFNHLDILKLCATKMSPQALAAAINEIPVVNGLTAMHDTVLRGTMVPVENFGGYYEQTKWLVENGGRSDIEDFSGRTQRNIAENAKNEEVRKRLLEIFDN